MTLRKTFTLAAGASLLTLALPLVAQEAQPVPDTTMETPAPAPPEVPSTPAPVEAPPPPAPPETPAPPSPPPAQAETMPMPMDPAAPPPPGTQMPANPAPGTMPGAQNTNITNPPPAAQAVYPPCSRTVVDQCQQREGRATRRRPR